MHFDSFRNNVFAGVSRVVCPKYSPDMDEGWDEGMDSMVGIPCLVISKNKYSVILESPSGMHYSFGYKYIELEKLKKRNISVGKYTFLINDTIHRYVLIDMILDEDKKILFKDIGVTSQNDLITLTSDQLNQIQSKCPRIIGALLSNNLMEIIK